MIYLLIPARNEAENILHVLSCFSNKKNVVIIIIDDDSTDNSHELYQNLIDVKIIRNEKWLGRNQSLKVGLQTLVNINNNDWIVFFDADRQHVPEFVLALEDNDSKRIIKGKRFSKIRNNDYSKIPVDRITISIIFDYLCFEFFGIHVQDINCGLIAFRYAEKSWIINECKFDHHISMEIYLKAFLRKGIDFIQEVDIQPIYEIRTLNDVNKYLHESQHERFFKKYESLLNKFIDILGREVTLENEALRSLYYSTKTKIC
jgi:glycosyltransferase involved in cell wall biosynthesis